MVRAEISSAVSGPDNGASFAPWFDPPQAEASYIIKTQLSMYTSRLFNVPASEEASSCSVAVMLQHQADVVAWHTGPQKGKRRL